MVALFSFIVFILFDVIGKFQFVFGSNFMELFPSIRITTATEVDVTEESIRNEDILDVLAVRSPNVDKFGNFCFKF